MTEETKSIILKEEYYIEGETLEIKKRIGNRYIEKIITTNRIIIVDEDCITVYNKLTDSEPPKD